jgi:hypothetical protein
MTRYGQIGWRMAAVVAFVGTAALAIALTRAPVRQNADLSSDLSARVCATSGLEAWLGLGAAASGRASGGSGAEGPGRAGVPPADSAYYTLEFTNVSDRACSLYGYPEVSAYRDGLVNGGQFPGGQLAGSQIGSAAIRDTSVRPKPVMLAPGATAHAVLRVVVTASSRPPAGCAQVTAEELRVTLPRQGRPSIVPAHIPLCAKSHVSLSVQPIQARPGLPGHTMVP